ncbi:hypothetical protein BDW02DRAFT_335213 [Decorospora gaudefroyi]|uniref:Uncharacterized protein n=1 Tax=Decorospora gaudefroyi TaxID=184978 RepID=A0A6A5KEK5_9PLEO|nr:hypothetical protein BDW02DRAFT_335213 [Decorospora gaudefroyi]
MQIYRHSPACRASHRPSDSIPEFLPSKYSESFVPGLSIALGRTSWQWYRLGLDVLIGSTEGHGNRELTTHLAVVRQRSRSLETAAANCRLGEHCAALSSTLGKDLIMSVSISDVRECKRVRDECRWYLSRRHLAQFSKWRNSVDLALGSGRSFGGGEI